MHGAIPWVCGGNVTEGSEEFQHMLEKVSEEMEEIEKNGISVEVGGVNVIQVSVVFLPVGDLAYQRY